MLLKSTSTLWISLPQLPKGEYILNIIVPVFIWLIILVFTFSFLLFPSSSVDNENLNLAFFTKYLISTTVINSLFWVIDLSSFLFIFSSILSSSITNSFESLYISSYWSDNVL